MAGKTPLMDQYKKIQEQYQDSLLFFRLGRLLRKCFLYDAVTASRELELTLTGRNAGMDERAPMCGVPFHSAEVYIYRLIQKGYKVAVCEQMEYPKTAKGLVKRDVIRVVTPGTILFENAIAEKSNNYLAYVKNREGDIAAAVADISTGECWWGVWKQKQENRRFSGYAFIYQPSEINLLL